MKEPASLFGFATMYNANRQDQRENEHFSQNHCEFCNVVWEISCLESFCSVILSCITYSMYKLLVPLVSLSKQVPEEMPDSSNGILHRKLLLL